MPSLQNEATVLGALLRVDLCGWTGPAPLLPREPIAQLDGGVPHGQSFVYDLLPNRALIPVGEACDRISAVIQRALEDWPFSDAEFPPRLRLDLGLTIDNPASPWQVNLPPALLGALADAGIELNLCGYSALMGSEEDG